MASVLEQAGYEVRAEANGTAIARLAREFRPDIAVLNAYCDAPPCGYTMTRSLSGTTSLVTLLVLRKGDPVELRLFGIESGADQLIFQPFSETELKARVSAMLRRTGRNHLGSLIVGDVVIDERSRQASRDGQPLNLTPREFDLLLALARHAESVLSKQRLSTEAWDSSAWARSTLPTHMGSLRRKLEALGPRIIHTVHGLGYVLRKP